MTNKLKTIFFLTLCLLLASTVSAGWLTSEHVDVDGDINITYYGSSTNVGISGNYLSIGYNGQEYYMDQDKFEQMASYDNHILQLLQYDAGKYKGLNFVFDSHDDRIRFQLNNTKFSFDYKDGRTIGNDDNANQITKLYYANGSEMESVYDNQGNY